MNLREAALELVADRGLLVFPCDSDKKPRTTHGFKDASRDLDDVETWFRDSDALIGVPTGRENGLLVVDIDPAGHDWYHANSMRLHCCRIHQTQRGFHLLYRMPEIEIRNSAGKLAPGVDVRGEGGYIIWWPAHGCDVAADDEPGPAPQWLLELLALNNVKPAVSAVNGAHIPEGQRDDALFRLAGKLRNHGLSAEAIAAGLIVHNTEHCVPPLPEAQVRKIATSITRYNVPAVPNHGDDPPPIARRWMDWAALAGAEPPARAWHVNQWASAGPMLLSGRGGSGKTLLAQQFGTALALQKQFLAEVPKAVKVLMWACEDDHDELWRRQRDICRWLDIGMSDLSGNFTIEPRLGLENTLFATAYGSPTWTVLLEHLAEQLNDLSADVLIVDNIGQAFGGSENDRHHVTAFINGLLGIRPGITVMMLGHTAKSIGSEFSGSTAWENAVRMRWYLGSTLPDQAPKDDELEPDPAVRYVSKRKANYTAQDWRRLTYSNGVLIPDDVATGGRYDARARNETVQAIVLKGLRRLAGINMDATPSKNSPDYLPRRLIDMKFNEDASKSELGNALNVLLADRRVAIQEIRGADRHPRKVLRPAGEVLNDCGK